MATRKRLILFVEGPGDKDAVPVLVKRLLTDLQAWEHVSLDPQPFTVGEVAKVTAQDGKKWLAWLRDAYRRPNLGGVLLLLDGDVERIRGEDFCAAIFATKLSEQARQAGAGVLFSVATVFAMQEFESWVIAGVDQLAGKPLPDGRAGVKPDTTAPTGNLEEAPRGAKEWLNESMVTGYLPTRDQKLLTTRLLEHLQVVRERPMRSFRRLENALQQLIEAIRTGVHVVTPQAGAP